MKFHDDRLPALILIGPFFSVFILFLLYPIFNIIYYSFTDYNLFTPEKFVGLANFKQLFSDPIFLQSIKNTVVYAFSTSIPSLVFGFFVAVGLNQRSVIGRSSLRLMFYLPYIPSLVSMAIVWMWFYDPQAGLFNTILEFFNLPPQTWLSNPQLALPSIVAVGVWQQVGYNMLIYLSALQSVPNELYESANIDGAKAWHKIVFITIPMVKQTTFYLVVVALIRSFSVFGQVNIMTNGGPLNTTTTIVHQIYTRGLGNFRFGYANAMTLILLLALIFITILNFRYGKTAHETE